MLQYNTVTGQSLLDICLNTYGSCDLLYKLISDNAISDINYTPMSGESFTWDETLTSDQAINQTSINNNIRYATATQANGSVLSIVESSSQGGGINPPLYQPPKVSSGVLYQKTSEVQYIGAGGESLFILSELVGGTIVQITREVQPLLASMYSFNQSSGQITLTGNALVQYEVVYIIYNQMITI